MQGPRPKNWLPVILAFCIPLCFAFYTNHAWEDYYITLRSSCNLVAGNGLVFQPGERLHTFTSPLGVLLPALCTWLVGLGNEMSALWLFRFINCAFLALAVWQVWRRFDALGLGAFARFVFFGLLFSDSKLVDFSINGMETAILVWMILQLWSELEADEGPRVWVLGLVVGGLMWTRPDSFVIIGALLAARVFIRPSRADSGVPPWGALTRGVLLGALVYLPWFGWAWWYYGTPVPHTILAKAAFTPPVHWQALYLFPYYTLTGRTVMVDLFLPSYWSHGGWPEGLVVLATFLTVPTVFAWLVPGWSFRGRRLSFSLFIGMFYLCAIILFPWYAPPWRVLACLSLAFAADEAIKSAFALRYAWFRSLLRCTGLLVVMIQVATLLAVAFQMRVQQCVIENGIRRQIGEFLHAQSKPGDSVFMEPLGYIGYYSRLKTYDFPGLSSQEVVAAVRGGARSYPAIIQAMKPTWVVLRPWEQDLDSFRKIPVLKDYELVRTWDRRQELGAQTYLPGRAWLENDACFRVFRRKESGFVPGPVDGRR